ncbi:MAG: type II secretion system F family protein [Lachnospiraceae bacterium]|nr:type II secretion system F family protein [Lachnospiraceae bacterium]
MADLRELAVFCHKMTNALRAGFDIERALIIMQDDTHGPLGGAIKRTLGKVSRGTALSSAMRPDEEIFTPELVNCVFVTEQTGHIEKAFSRMAVIFDERMTIQRKIRQAALYPSIVLIVFVGALMAVAYVWHFLPQAIAIVAGIILVLVGIIFLRSGGAALSQKSDLAGRFVLGLPVIGKLLKKTELADFASNMSAFYDCGMPVEQGLRYSLKTLRHAALQNKIRRAADWVAEGNPLSDALQMQGIFPHDLINSLRTGEQSGNVSEMLDHIAKYYREDVRHSIDMVFTVIRQ